ncbi:MAG: DNA-3-methyladenine glycosylase [Thermoleophilaceae bacterium]
MSDPRRRSFYDRSVHEVARDLVGCTVRHGDTSGRIVEVESYHEEEPACHAYAGLTPRTEVLFGPPGNAYVYRSYGIHAMLNAVSEEEGLGAAVLIRALEPIDGIELMRLRRRVDGVNDLCSGPGKLTQALGIWLDLNGTPLTGGGPIDFLPRPADSRPPEVVLGERIGITRAVDLPWRFCDATSSSVSRPLPPAMRARARRAA